MIKIFVPNPSFSLIKQQAIEGSEAALALNEDCDRVPRAFVLFDLLMDAEQQYQNRSSSLTNEAVIDRSEAVTVSFE